MNAGATLGYSNAAADSNMQASSVAFGGMTAGLAGSASRTRTASPISS